MSDQETLDERLRTCRAPDLRHAALDELVRAGFAEGEAMAILREAAAVTLEGAAEGMERAAAAVNVRGGCSDRCAEKLRACAAELRKTESGT